MSSSKPGTIVGLMAISVLVAAAGLLYVRYVRPPMNVAYVSEEEGGVKVINLSTLQVVRGVQPADFAPRGIGITFDGKYLITADKDTCRHRDFQHSSPEYREADKNRGQSGVHQAGSERRQALCHVRTGVGRRTSAGGRDSGRCRADADDENEPPAQIATFSVPDWTPGTVSTAGKETEGLEFSTGRKVHDRRE